jgi:hypothetical protein
VPEITASKLLHVLVPRYQHLHGGYLRILRNGFHSSGTDRAPVAIIEFVSNPRDIVYHTSLKEKPAITRQLESITAQKYSKSVSSVVAKSGKTKQTVQLVKRNDINSTILKRLSAREHQIKKRLQKFERNEKAYLHARKIDELSVEAIHKMYELNSQNGTILPPKDMVERILPVSSFKAKPVLEVAQPVPQKIEAEKKPPSSWWGFKKSRLAERMYKWATGS